MFRLIPSITRHNALRKVNFSTPVDKAPRKQKLIAFKKSSDSHIKLGVGAVTIGVVGFCIYQINTDPNGFLGKLYKGSSLQRLVEIIHDQTVGRVEEMFDAPDKLIPDWPTAPCYGGIPLGTPAPPLLVVDLERTLIGTTHDYNLGYRHAKRPGLDKFINSLSQYYEIVIFSENDVNTVAEILAHIDPEGKCHKLGSAAAEIRDTAVLKRLDKMNRDISKIILIDDSTVSSSLFPRNTLLVKPYTDVKDKTDTTLLDLIPLLQAFVHDEVKDFRDTIDRLGTHEAEEACVEYRMRLAQKKQDEEHRRNRGLGGLLRGVAAKGIADEVDHIHSLVPSASQIVGAAPTNSEKYASASSSSGGEAGTGKSPAVQGIITPFGVINERKKGPAAQKKGAVLDWLQQREEALSSEKEIHMSKMQELHQKRETEKAAAAAARQQQQAQ